MWGILVAAISGALMSIQGVMNAEVTKQTSVWLSASFVQLTALCVCLLAWVITGHQGTIGGIVHVTPRYMLLGGVLGAFITITVIYAMNTVGPARATVYIVSVQLLASYLIEFFGILGVDKQPFEWRRCIGIVVMIAGIAIFKWR